MCVFILFSPWSLIIHINVSLYDTIYCTTSFHSVQLTMDDGSSETCLDWFNNMNFKNFVWFIKAISYFVLLRSLGNNDNNNNNNNNNNNWYSNRLTLLEKIKTQKYKFSPNVSMESCPPGISMKVCGPKILAVSFSERLRLSGQGWESLAAFSSSSKSNFIHRRLYDKRTLHNM